MSVLRPLAAPGWKSVLPPALAGGLRATLPLWEPASAGFSTFAFRHGGQWLKPVVEKHAEARYSNSV
jgi:hypothetical protein